MVLKHVLNSEIITMEVDVHKLGIDGKPNVEKRGDGKGLDYQKTVDVFYDPWT